jgi:hypothetical protein
LDCQSGTRTRCERDTRALRTFVLFYFVGHQACARPEP